jgi:hypothetical protein
MLACYAYLFLSTSCLFYTRHTPEEVSEAIMQAGVIGSSSADAIGKLRNLRFANGDSLLVGEYVPDRRVIEATFIDASRKLTARWSVNVLVKFDSLGVASDLEVYNSEIDPM